MVFFSEKLNKYKHFLLLFIFIPLQALFILCERNLKPKYYMMSWLDLHIPFVKEFVVPYLFWYIYMIAAIIYLGFVSKKDYMRLVSLLAGGMTISCLIYIMFPNAQNLRPVISQTDVFSDIIKYIYSNDTPTDVAPSLHVFNSIVVHSCLVMCPNLNGKRKIKVASFLCMITICASTVFIKQHSILDVFWGSLLAFVLIWAVYGLPNYLPYKAHKDDKADITL